MGQVMMEATGDEIIEALRSVLEQTERLRWQRPELVASAAEPIAIVSMSCRLPGGVASPEDLWRLLADGRDAVGPLPADRGWDLSTPAEGFATTAAGGFLANVADFDAAFFGISEREALSMDPQQRLLLETAWEAFERTGIDPATLRGSATGVFVGTTGEDYSKLILGSRGDIDAHAGAGAANSVLSSRLASSFGLEGPAVTVDTAASSSLVAVHLAVNSLRAGESDLAVAGGVSVMTTRETLIAVGRRGDRAADGRCRAFAERASGAGWSEGVGLLLLERLSDARDNGHHVHAIIRGSAVNHGGRSRRLVTSDGRSQRHVIRQALRTAGLSGADVDAVDADGVGTPSADLIEAQALLDTYGQQRKRPLYLGSVKSNLGHTQAAAGVAGVIKMVLAIHHGILPRTLHVDQPSSRVDWSTGAVELLAEAIEWPRTGRVRRAGVSSFGVGGTNAHVVIEQAEPSASTPPAPAPDVVPWAVSAKGPEALNDQVDRLLAVDAAPVDVGYSLATGRSSFIHRTVLLAGAEDPIEVARGIAEKRSLAFVFPGAGSLARGAGQELYRRFPVFASAFDEAATLLAGLPGRTDHLDHLHRAGIVDARAFAIEVALSRLLASVGVRPHFVAGHSIGAVAAAHVAGVLSLHEACKLVKARDWAVRTGGGPETVAALRSDFSDVVESLDLGEPTIPLVVSGDFRTVRFWLRDAWETARFADLVDTLSASRGTVFLQIGSGEMLTSWINASVVVDALPRDRPEVAAVLTAVGRLWTTGVDVDWAALTAGGRRVDLPTYAFQRRRFWPSPVAQLSEALVAGSSLDGEPPPAAENIADTVLFTATLSAADLPWLPASGQFPAAGLLDLALGAAERVGCGCIDELTLLRPLIVPLEVPVTVNIEVAAPGDAAGRWLRIYSRRDDAIGDWTEHAAGILVAGVRRIAVDPREWPPTNAVREDSDAHPLLRGVWHDGDETYVEAALPEGVDVGGYRIHPALLDAVATAAGRTVGSDGDPLVPLCWTGTSLYAAGATELRALITRTGPDETTIVAVDAHGAPVLSADSLVWATPVDDAAAPTRDRGSLLRLCWRPVAAPPPSDHPASDHPQATPAEADAVVVPIGAASADAAADARTLTARASERIEQWLAEERPSTARLVFLTRDAVAAHPGDPVDDVAAAAVWGLVRWAQAEHPGRFVLIDRTGSGGPSLAAVLATGESELVIRDDVVLAARMIECSRQVRGSSTPWDPDGTVLVTGAADTLGAEFIRHLVAEHGIQHLMLVDRQGQIPVILQAELIAHGVEVTVAVCDSADRETLAGVIAGVPAEHPLTAVVHTAGVLDTGIATSSTVGRHATAPAPKAEYAWHLHELTLGADLAAFVTFSSISGLVGAPGAADEAAASAFLDALAEHRACAGLPAMSLAWGAWADESGRGWRAPSGHGPANPLSVADGVALLHAAMRSAHASVVAIGGLNAPRVVADPIPNRGDAATPLRPDRPSASPTAHPHGLCRLEWVPAPRALGPAVCWSTLEAMSTGPRPELVVAEVSGPPGDDVAQAVHEITMRTFDLAHRWLTDQKYAGTPLVVRTHNAVVAAANDRVHDVAAAAVWGVIRAVQAEHPGRFVLLDGEADDTILAALAHLIARGDARFAIRDGVLLVGRCAASRSSPNSATGI
jgi:acyl transferase domain-containing protein